MRKEFPLTVNGKQFGLVSAFSPKGKPGSFFVYAERWSKGKQFKGITPCKTFEEAVTKAEAIKSGVEKGVSFFISRESQAGYEAYEEAKGKPAPKATPKTAAKKPQIVL